MAKLTTEMAALIPGDPSLEDGTVTLPEYPGLRGPKHRVFVGDAVPAMEVGLELSWYSRRGHVVCLNRDDAWIEIEFLPEWFYANWHYETKTTHTFRVTDDMAGTLVYEPVSAVPDERSAD